jgi:hypothetical protein
MMPLFRGELVEKNVAARQAGFGMSRTADLAAVHREIIDGVRS